MTRNRIAPYREGERSEHSEVTIMEAGEALAVGIRRAISVTVRSGSKLSVDFKREEDRFSDVTLTGPADFAFEGTIEI